MLKCNWALVGKVGWTCSTGLGTSLTAWLSKELEVRLKVPLPMLGSWCKLGVFWFQFWHKTWNDDIIKLHYELQKYTKTRHRGWCRFFLRSKRLTGRLAVVIVSVKPFAKIVGCYLCHNRDNEFCYELQGIHLPPSWYLGDSVIIISFKVWFFHIIQK